MRSLSREQIASYERDGFLFPVPVMSPDGAAAYRAKLERFREEHPDYTTGIAGQKMHLVTTWMAEIIRHPRILDAVESLLGPDLLCWTAALFAKDSDGKSFVSWHQDGNYWGLNNHEVATAWLALSPSTVESGCMRMLPGSHAWEQVSHTDTYDDDNLLSRGQVMETNIDETKARNIIVQPGEISLHHVNVAHASAPNHSGATRFGIAIRYITPNVRQGVGAKDSATLVRGEDHIGNFELEDRPAQDFNPAAVALLERVIAQRKQSIYQDTPDRD